MKKIFCCLTAMLLFFSFIGCRSLQSVHSYYSDIPVTTAKETTSATTIAKTTKKSTKATAKITTEKAITTTTKTVPATTSTMYPPVRQDFRLMVNGRDLTESYYHTCKEEQEYEFPLTLIIKELGGIVNWISNSEAVISFEDETYYLNTNECRLVQMEYKDETDYNIMISPPGGGVPQIYYIANGEFIINLSFALFPLLQFDIAWRVNLATNTLEFEHHTKDGKFSLKDYENAIDVFCYEGDRVRYVSTASWAVILSKRIWQQEWSGYHENAEFFSYINETTVLLDENEDVWLIQGVIPSNQDVKLPTAIIKKDGTVLAVWWADKKVAPK